MLTIKQVTYPEARAEFFAAQRKILGKKLDRHVSKMARDDAYAYLSAAQDKASALGQMMSFFSDAERVFSDDFLHDFSTICICAVRYAIGRRTYMPRLVQDFITANIDMVDSNGIACMIRDIRDHGGVGTHRPSAYGDLHDYEAWMSFLSKLESHQKAGDTTNESE